MSSEAKQSRTARGIYLVGFSGTGKSTIARIVSAKLQWPACDLDELIVERCGRSIAEIFQQEGEPGFRQREAEALHAVSSQGAFVVATGGGIVVREENRQYMAGKGWVICLEAQPHTILARVQRQALESDPKGVRPMLDAADRLEKIRSLKNARQSAYACADWTVHTDRLTAEEIAAEVIRAVEILERSEFTSSVQ
jgi:shikimate kinase